MRLLQGVGAGGGYVPFHVECGSFSIFISKECEKWLFYCVFTDYSSMELTYQNVRSTLFRYWS